MIETEDLMGQRLIYTKNGIGRYAIAAYCPGPSVMMVNLDTGEECNFRLGSLLDESFKAIPGAKKDPGVLMMLKHKELEKKNRVTPEWFWQSLFAAPITGFICWLLLSIFWHR